MNDYSPIERKDVKETLSEILLYFKLLFTFCIGSIRRFLLLFLFLFLGMASGSYYFNEGKKSSYYSAKMVCTYNYLHKKVYGEMLERANYLAATHSFPTLAEEFELPVSTVEKIISIQATNIVGSPLHEDITEDKLPFYITVNVNDKAIYPHIQEAILNYLNNSIPYHNKRRELEEDRLKNNIKFYNATLDQVDRLINNYTDNVNRLESKNDSLTVLTEINSLFYQKQDLNTKLLSDQKMLEMQMAVELLYGFAPTTYPNVQTGISTSKLILISLGIAFCIVVLFNLMMPKKSNS